MQAQGRNQVVYQDTANPTTNVHCRSRPANRSQKVAEPAKGNQLQDTPRKTAGAPGRGTEATPEEANREPTPHLARGEKEDIAPPPQKEILHTHRDHQRWGPAAKTHRTPKLPYDREKRRIGRRREKKKKKKKSTP